jgi:PIN domain nuclease of toxin-antitoxin system
MRCLIDTHVLIWHAENQNLSQEELDIINNPQNTIYVSHATLWEMTI